MKTAFECFQKEEPLLFIENGTAPNWLEARLRKAFLRGLMAGQKEERERIARQINNAVCQKVLV